MEHSTVSQELETSFSIQRAPGRPHSSKSEALSMLQCSRGIGFQPTILFPILNPQPPLIPPEAKQIAFPPSKPVPNKLTIFIEFLIFCLATTILGLSSAYGAKMQSLISTNVPNSMAPYYAPPRFGTSQPSDSILVFYVATVPGFTIVMSVFGFVLAVRGLVTRRYSILVSIVFLFGWLGQVGWWLGCEVHASASTACPQSKIQVGMDGEIGKGLGTTKLGFGILVIVVYAVYAGVSLFFPVVKHQCDGCQAGVEGEKIGRVEE